MSLLGLRFRTIAYSLQLLEYHHPDLAFELVSNLVATQLTNRWERALAHGKGSVMKKCTELDISSKFILINIQSNNPGCLTHLLEQS